MNKCNVFYICGSYRGKGEMNVGSFALDFKFELEKFYPYLVFSYLHRFEYTFVSVGFDVSFCLNDLKKKSTFSLKLFVDF